MLILQNVFVHLPTDFLLAFVSFVNKTWNTEAQKIVRDHQKCTTENPNTASPCDFLQKLDRICEQMTEKGRVIPINCVRLKWSPGRTAPCNCNDLSFSNLFSNSELKLKHFECAREETFVNPSECYKALWSLLKWKLCGLLTMQLDSISVFDPDFLFESSNEGKWIPEFTQLRSCNIQDVSFPSEDMARKQKTVQWLLNNAQSLR